MFWSIPDSLNFRSKSARRPNRTIRSTARRFRWACLIVTAGLSTGCMSSNDELKYWGDEREITHYKDTATAISYPDVSQASPEKVVTAQSPRRVGELKKENIEDLTLDIALKTALMNAEVIRDNGQFLSAGNRLLNNPDFVSSVHDIAVQETNTLFGQGGVQAALSEFDATFTANMTWGRTEQISESASIGFNALQEQDEEFADFRTQLQKIFGHGGSLTVSHNWFYSGQNQNPGANGGRPFASIYTSRPGRGQDAGLPTLGAEYREPLWQGRGTEYTRIAGPIARRPTLQSTPTVNQGVVIASIRTDISISDFEASVATLLKDVEDVYWELYLGYRTYDTERVALLSALQTWREVKASSEAGRAGAADEAQARDNYFEIRARSENALSQLYSSEIRLRRLLGLSANDGNVLRPVTEPITGLVVPDWNICLTEALAKRPELRRQKWNIKSLELQHKAAEMLVNPRLDFVARYQINGFGDRLMGEDTSRFHSAYASLVQGDQTGWGLGFEFSMPLGFRGALTQVQNLEHRLSKARSILAEQETEVSLELAAVMQQLAQNYQTARTNFNRRRAAERRVQAFLADYKAGRTTLDLVLRAQISLSQAETAYFSSLIGYNRALADLKFRKGSILVDSNVFLSEGLWTPVAYEDAMRRAWERSFAFPAPNMDTHPTEYSLDYPDGTPNEWANHAEPMPEMESLPPTVDPSATPLVPPPVETDAVKPDNKSALLPNGQDNLLNLTNVRTENASTQNQSGTASKVNLDSRQSQPRGESLPIGAPALKPLGQSESVDRVPFGDSDFQSPIPATGGLTPDTFEPPVIQRHNNATPLEQPLEFQTPIPKRGSSPLKSDEFYVPQDPAKTTKPIEKGIQTIGEPTSARDESAQPWVVPFGSSRRDLLKPSPGPVANAQQQPSENRVEQVGHRPFGQPQIQRAEAVTPAGAANSGASHSQSWGQFLKRDSK